MAQATEPRTASVPANIQDVFLNYARRERLSVNVHLIGCARYVDGTEAIAHVLIIFVITIAAAEVGLALAIVLRMFRNWETVNLDRISTLQQ